MKIKSRSRQTNHLLALTLGLWILTFALGVHARPEYAVKHGVISCTACHMSPSGGGIRNTYGKFYGARGRTPNEHHERPFYQVDARAILTTTQEVREDNNGLGLMELLGAANVPISKTADTNTHFVGTYYFGNFSQAVGLRDTYVRWEYERSKFLEHALVGKFIPPFGLLTDEHRTYARWATKSTWNNFEMGAMVSGRLSRKIHWDFAAVNGFQKAATEGAGNFSQGDTYGLYLNLRTKPFRPSIMLGASGSFYRRHSGLNSPYAVSLYSGVGLESLTGGRLRGSVLFEHVRAQYFSDGIINPEFGRLFGGGLDASYVNALKNEISEGYYLQFLYDFTQHFALQYKWDKFIPSTNFTGDYFDRYGLGFKYQATANLQWIVRGEWVDIGRPGVDKTSANMAADNYYILAHYWF